MGLYLDHSIDNLVWRTEVAERQCETLKRRVERLEAERDELIRCFGEERVDLSVELGEDLSPNSLMIHTEMEFTVRVRAWDECWNDDEKRARMSHLLLTQLPRIVAEKVKNREGSPGLRYIAEALSCQGRVR